RPARPPRRTAPCRRAAAARAATRPSVSWSSGSQQSQLLQGVRDALVLLLDELGELVTGAEGVDPAVVLQRLLPPRAVVHLLEVADELLAALTRDAGRGEHPAPVAEDQVDARLLQGRYVGHCRRLEPLLAGDREDPQLAGLDLSLELADAGEADLDLAT